MKDILISLIFALALLPIVHLLVLMFSESINYKGFSEWILKGVVFGFGFCSVIVFYVLIFKLLGK